MNNVYDSIYSNLGLSTPQPRYNSVLDQIRSNLGLESLYPNKTYAGVYSSFGLPTPQPQYNSTLEQIRQNMGLNPSYLAIKGGQGVPAVDVVSWVNQHSPSDLLAAIGKYNINPIDLLATYNAVAGTNVSPSQALRYLRRGGQDLMKQNYLNQSRSR